MSIRKTIGGDRLGSGKKMKVDLKSYERSTHDTSRVVRTTMSSGTLVPFLVRPILPGSTWDIDLNAMVLTHPTIGPLFGSYKVQLDVFICPIRCYIARLHNNESGLGMDMKNVYLPQMEVPALVKQKHDINDQVNTSALIRYLGISGIGTSEAEEAEEGMMLKRTFNATALLAYYEIVKNYYCNQQEEVGYVIDNGLNLAPTQFDMFTANQDFIDVAQNSERTWYRLDEDSTVVLTYTATDINDINPNNIVITFIYETLNGGEKTTERTLTNLFNKIDISGGESIEVTLSEPKNDTPVAFAKYWKWHNEEANTEPKLREFDIKAVDRMKRNVLIHPYSSPLVIDENSEFPYNSCLRADNPENKSSALGNQQGLAVKTYQNDIFNNWMNSEWVDGENGINSITAVQIVDDKLEIPSLILARKVFNVLNRIALSGGTYDDFLEVTYDHQRINRVESPAYLGGLIKELSFEEVVSTAAAEGEGGLQPLGELAGRGQMTNKHKGGRVTVKADEPSYVIGIVSLTPRIDYSQGNEWDVNLKNMDEFHKPELDAIGFQDLITEQMDWRDTLISDDEEENTTFKSAGKQPAWINYQTSFNKTFGNFANEEQMWMTLNRRYEWEDGEIKDLTSYIDPKKFNHIFADTRRDAQNFWVQIGMNITARQKMSAKVMPNL